MMLGVEALGFPRASLRVNVEYCLFILHGVGVIKGNAVEVAENHARGVDANLHAGGTAIVRKTNPLKKSYGY
jgi:hypothetical protein